MKILFASAEIAPFAKVGGLADVAGSLPKAIKNLELDIRLIMPAYGSIDFNEYKVKDVKNSQITLNLGGREIQVSLKKGKLPNSDVVVYFVDNDEYFTSIPEVYPKNCTHRFEQERFVLFGKAVLEFAKVIGFKPDVIHCNDWHTSVIPLCLKTEYKYDAYFKDTSSVFSIHNLAYQGITDRNMLNFANLESYNVFNIDGVEFYGNVNWMKGAVNYSDAVNTVSENYAQEIQTQEYGEKLDGLLRHVNYKLKGIVNGIDYSVWNPECDKNLAKNFSVKNLKGKQKCKQALQKGYELPANSETPLIGLISRLVDQKGLDLIAEISDSIQELNMQFVILGSGDAKYEGMFRELTRKSKNIRAAIGYNAQLAERIYAGCDMFLMPSRFEPCGLGQLISLRYGTIPIVRKTGGLADTIFDYDSYKLNYEKSNGFVFDEYNSNELLRTIERALYVYKNKEDWNKLVKRAMEYDSSWETSAQKYVDLYIKSGK